MALGVGLVVLVESHIVVVAMVGVGSAGAVVVQGHICNLLLDCIDAAVAATTWHIHSFGEDPTEGADLEVEAGSIVAAELQVSDDASA